MINLQTEVLVIGGGAVGAGILRDLAMRGIHATLVEKNDLATGTTGRYHGLLHSGGRYVVRDPLAAKECIEENRILRKIMPQCLEDSGGFFVLTPWDDPEYIPRFLDGCQKAGIPCEEVPISQMLREEPLLNPNITLCFRVPDACADSFLSTRLNVASAKHYGAQVLNYHLIEGLLLSGGRVIGAKCYDRVKDENVQIRAELVISATGAWAGKIGSMAGIHIPMAPGKGTMVAVNHRIVNTVINRCSMPADAQIIVPAHTVAVIGTTDVKVTDPDHFSIEPWEVHLMLEEGEKLVPGFRDMRMLRAWAGVRPLYQDNQTSADREMTRAFVLLDHEVRDGLPGLITITSGKWTTYRKMAEVTVDLVCRKLGIQRPCSTHLEPLPSTNEPGYHYLGARLNHIEREKTYGKLICECELVTEENIQCAIIDHQARTIDDIRRETRLGMGPCQGGFCTIRAAGIFHKLRNPPVHETNNALADFLEERWKGVLPVLWGQQMRQERLNELIYLSLLNVDHLPRTVPSRLAPEPYAPPESSAKGHSEPIHALNVMRMHSQELHRSPLDVLIVGAGLSGLTAAWQLAQHYQHVRLISKGWGALYWHTGCVDVLGYYPYHQPQLVESPLEALARIIRDEPTHPYALIGIEAIQEALSALKTLCAEANYPLHGSLDRNLFLPTALGAIRPSCLAPETMLAGDLRTKDPMLIIGFEGFLDFYPELIAANLSAQGFPAYGLSAKLPSLNHQRVISHRILAEFMERPEFRREVIAIIKENIFGQSFKFQRVGFPAILGLYHPGEVLQDLQEQLSVPVFEIPTLPPSIPGIRLSRILVESIRKLGGQVFEGMKVTQPVFDQNSNKLIALQSEAAARIKTHYAKNFILATGGFLGGGIQTDFRGDTREIILNLPVPATSIRNHWFQYRFLSPEPHPVFCAGISVNRNFQPIDSSGNILYENLYAIGTSIYGYDDIRQRSFEGAALASGYWVGNKILQTYP